MEKLKTGTTCIGVKYKEGVLLAGDKRVSMGSMIAYSNMTKVIKIADNIGITTAGEVASIQLVLRHIQKR